MPKPHHLLLLYTQLDPVSLVEKSQPTGTNTNVRLLNAAVNVNPVEIKSCLDFVAPFKKPLVIVESNSSTPGATKTPGKEILTVDIFPFEKYRSRLYPKKSMFNPRLEIPETAFVRISPCAGRTLKGAVRSDA